MKLVHSSLFPVNRVGFIGLGALGSFITGAGGKGLFTAHYNLLSRLNMEKMNWSSLKKLTAVYIYLLTNKQTNTHLLARSVTIQVYNQRMACPIRGGKACT